MKDTKYKYLKRFLALVLSAAIIITYMPTSLMAYASDETNAPAATEQAAEETKAEETTAPEAKETTAQYPILLQQQEQLMILITRIRQSYRARLQLRQTYLRSLQPAERVSRQVMTTTSLEQ